MRRVLVCAVVAAVLVALVGPVSVVGAGPPGDPTLLGSGFRWHLAGGTGRVVYSGPGGLWSVQVSGRAAPVSLASIVEWSDHFTVSPDGSTVVYWTWSRPGGESRGLWEFFSVAVEGGTPVKIHEHRDPVDAAGYDGYTTDREVLVSPDSSLVVVSSFVCFEGEDDGCDRGDWFLHSAPVRGGEVTLLGAGTGPYPVEYRPVVGISSDSSRVVYSTDLMYGDGGLWSVPIEGREPVRLGGAGHEGISDWVSLSLDSERVVYRAYNANSGRNELFSVPIDGGRPVKLNGPLVAGGNVSQFEVSPDSKRVAYVAVQDTPNKAELFSVPIDGGRPVKLNGPLVPEGDVKGLVVAPDSERVVYLANQVAAGKEELFSVPIDGGRSVKLNGPLVRGGDVRTLVVAPDSERVVYMANQDTKRKQELFSVPIDGGRSVKLNGPLVDGGNVALGFAVSPDSKSVSYVADQDVDQMQDVFAVSIEGGPAVKLNHESWDWRSDDRYRVRSDLAWTSDSSYLIYRASVRPRSTLHSVDTSVRCKGTPATIRGTTESEVITGTDSVDVIAGLAGDDQIRGRSGADRICGGPGDDTIHGGSGADMIWGQRGQDTIHGNNDRDTISGGSGADTIFGNRDRDTISGGPGPDVIEGGKRGDTIRANSGDDLLRGNSGHDELRGGKGTDTCRGGKGNDTAYSCETATGL